MGSLGDNYAGNTIGQLKDPVYTVALGVPAEYTAWALSVPRLLDAFFDPIVGLWSDNWLGRWGRRRPFIFAGALGLGVALPLIWLPPSDGGWSPMMLAGYFMATSMLFYAAYSIFLVPYRALGLELTTDYHDRTRLQGWGMIVGLVGGFGIPWLYKLSLLFGGDEGSPTAVLDGVRWVGCGVGALVMVTCLIPAITCREIPPENPGPKIRLGPAVVATLRNRPFLLMIGMNFFVTIGVYAPLTVFQLVCIYSIYHGNQHAAATLMGNLGMAQMLGSLLGVPVNSRLSVWLGKRGAALAALAVAALGFASLVWTLQPAHPYWAVASALLIGWGAQGVWLMSATMNADVCDYDEFNTARRREGVYGAVFALEQKLAFAAAALLSGYLVTQSGYVAGSLPTDSVLLNLRSALVMPSLIGMGVAASFIAFYPLSHARIVHIQHQLIARRMLRPKSLGSSAPSDLPRS